MAQDDLGATGVGGTGSERSEGILDALAAWLEAEEEAARDRVGTHLDRGDSAAALFAFGKVDGLRDVRGKLKRLRASQEQE